MINLTMSHFKQGTRNLGVRAGRKATPLAPPNFATFRECYIVELKINEDSRTC